MAKRQLYTKTPVTSTFDELEKELLRVESAFNEVSEHLATDISTQPPAKVFDLMVRYADGINWNPGLGEGLYLYINGTWNKLNMEPVP